MSQRALKPDTDADIQLRRCLSAQPPKSFIMKAGAGSGKTTSLIKALKAILDVYGTNLRAKRQRVACITYTEVAAGEIWADVGNNPLIHVSTIHSFLWSVLRSFQADIKQWVMTRIDRKIEELIEEAENYGPRVQQRTRDKNQREIARYEHQRQRVPTVSSFSYGTGSDYAKGILGHDDILKMGSELILERPLLRSLIAQQFPFIFVDESQDTSAEVVDALKSIDRQQGKSFCLGFFGDPMQRIYMTGIGAISSEPEWENITKPENFRCASEVLSVANNIRRDDDQLVQTRGRMEERNGNLVSVPGNANLFVLPADDRRQERLQSVRHWASREFQDPHWLDESGDDAPKMLVIVHRMAATRLGFGTLYSALNDKAPDGFKSGFLDATAWPLKPFLNFVVPVVDAKNSGCEFEVMQLLRRYSPILRAESLPGANLQDRLKGLEEAILAITDMLKPASEATVRDVLQVMEEQQLYPLDARYRAYLKDDPLPAQEEDDDEDEADEEERTKELNAMQAYLACPAHEFWGYRTYVNQESPFSTQQGIKGAEFERVMVVLDDEEGTHVQFSYEKYFGVKEPSARDRKRIEAQEETAIERTRRLFYVCCTRALHDLVVVMFTADPERARAQIERLALFPEDKVREAAALEVAG